MIYIKGKIDKLDFVKIKSVHSAKKPVKRMKRNTIYWEKIITNHMSVKGLLSRINKELLNSTVKPNNSIRK